MKHGSLFSGIGGFDLAAKTVGWQNTFQVEKDRWCRKVLAKNFPEAHQHDDIRTFNPHDWAGSVDVISGGFPCQPFSVAGQRKSQADDRYLWPEMLRVVAAIRPTFVVGENVAGIISLALDQVLSDLEAEGYTTETFVLPACAIGAPHRRDRVWIVAHTNHTGCEKQRQHLPDQTEYAAPECGGWWEAEPGVCRVADGLPRRVDRLRALGNAIVPQVAIQLFAAIDQFYKTHLQLKP